MFGPVKLKAQSWQKRDYLGVEGRGMALADIFLDGSIGVLRTSLDFCIEAKKPTIASSLSGN